MLDAHETSFNDNKLLYMIMLIHFSFLAKTCLFCDMLPFLRSAAAAIFLFTANRQCV